MSSAHLPFDKRLGRMDRKRRKMARNGVVHSINHDGLIVARARRRAPRFPLKGLFLVFMAVMFFKAFLLASLGERVYDQRVTLLAEGSHIEQAGAWVMQADPLTRRMAQGLLVFMP